MARVHRENLKPFSDLDLVVMGEKPVDPLTFAALKDAFSESNLPFKVDVLDWATTDARFRDRIAQAFVMVQRGQQAYD